MVVVVYFGMFDLLMCGYEDFVWCVLSIFDMLVVGVVDSCVKKLFFLFEECLMIVNEVFGYYLNVKVMSFIGFLKDFVCVNNVCVIVCGLCVVFDFEYEFQMVGMNCYLLFDVEMMFMMLFDQYQFILGMIVCEIV